MADTAGRRGGKRPEPSGRRPRSAQQASGAPRPGHGERRAGGPRRDHDDRARQPRSGGSAQGSGRTGRAGDASPGGKRPRDAEPRLPDSVDLTLLDRETRAQLRSLSKPNAEAVAGHLIEAGKHLDDDPQRALAHARAARGRAARVGAVREAVGIAAYRAGEWAEALAELRAARRITGDPHNLAVIADCERGLGRPEQAARALQDPAVGKLDPESRAELFIVVAGARRDVGQVDAALAVLARGGLDTARPRPGSMRLWYAYADTLEAAGRREEAARWFAAAAGLDVTGETDAVDRAAALL